MKFIRKGWISFLSIFMFITMLSGEVTMVNAAEDQVIYLSDLNWESATVGYSTPQKDKGLESLPLRLRESAGGDPITYAKGICAHAQSKIVYNIENQGYETFKSYIGVNYSKTGGSTGFEVLIDNESVFKQDVLKESDAQMFVDVEIPEDAKVLTLITTDGGNGITADHSIWADAKFTRSVESLTKLGKVEAIAEATALNVGQISKITPHAYMISGDEITLQPINLSFTSSNANVLSVDQSGNLQAKSDGIATITTSYQHEGVTKSSVITFVVGKGDALNSWEMVSPNNNIRSVVSLIDGELHYVVRNTQGTLIEDSLLQLKTSKGDFSNGLSFVERSDTVVSDEYDLYGAKVSHVSEQGNETTLVFAKGDVEFSLVIRVYDTGFAFRYKVNGAEGDALQIESETSQFQLPQGSIAQASDYHAHHEKVAQEKQISELNSLYIMPFLYETPTGNYVLISEAALNPTYCGAALQGNGTGGVNAVFTPEQTTAVTTTLPFETPWRFVVIGDAATINENTMAETLSPDLAVEDVSWITPGVTDWTWLNRESTSSYDTYKRYVDFAVEMGWTYVLLDEGWQPKGASGSGLVYDGYYEWTDDLIEYANSKNIGLLVWANNSDLNTDAKREVIDEWAEMGFKGIKPDFFNSQSQATMKFYDALMKKTAENHMLLNIHGANKTTGERRMYPQLLTREGVFGAEQDLFDPSNVSARHNCMIPFTRNAVGPADYTPMLSYRNAGSRRSFTVSHMAALATVYESGIQCFADRPEVYQASPAYLYFKDYPTSFTTSKLIDGIPGEYVNIARNSGEDWYVGIIVNEARNIDFDFDFLGEGTYYAMIYTDGDSVDAIHAEYREVTKTDTMSFSIPATGGISMKIVKEKPTEPEMITLDTEEIEMQQYETQTITATITPSEVDFSNITWTSDDPTIATVSNGKVSGLNPGTTTIRATTGFSNDIVAECKVVVTPLPYSLADGWTTINEVVDKKTIQDETTMTIVTQPGEYYRNTNNAKNVVIREVDKKDFEITLALDFNPTMDIHTAGLILYANDTSLYGVFRRYHPTLGGNIISPFGLNGSTWVEKTAMDASPDKTVYLRIVKNGNTFSSYYSYDNQNFTKFADDYTDATLANAEHLYAGVYAVSGNNKSGETPATFQDFTIKYVGEEANVIPFGVANVDKTDLLTAIETGDALDQAVYTQVSWDSLQTALTEAKSVYNDEAATQEAIDNATTALNDAMDALVNKADKSVLNTLIDEANTKVEAAYTAESWAVFESAVADAKAISANDNATQEQVNSAAAALSTAINALETVQEETVNTEALQQLISASEALIEETYTPESWAVLVDALTSAQAVLANPEATQTDVDAATKALQAAKDALVAVQGETVNTEALQQLIKEIEALNTNDYTTVSWKQLQEVLADAKATLLDPEASQADIDAQVKALQAAKDKLAKQVTVIEKPSIAPTAPAVSGNGGSTNTGDTTNVNFLYAILLLSGVVVVRRYWKKKQG